MDHVSAGEATVNGVRHRRRRMRDQARALHVGPSPVVDRYQTPEWLDRSFVLPLTQPEVSPEAIPEVSAVPSQPVRRHDDDPGRVPEPRMSPLEAVPEQPVAADTTFVRPPSHEIDFARVIRRSDLTRRITRLHWVATGLAGLALVAFLLVSSTWVLALVVVFAVVAVAAFAVRFRLDRAPVPRLRR